MRTLTTGQVKSGKEGKDAKPLIPMGTAQKDLWRLRRLNTSEGKMTYPECLICFKEMIQETRIMHCFNGHLICGCCHNRLPKTKKTCPYCRQ